MSIHHKEISDAVLEEISNVIKSVDPNEANLFIEEVLNAEKIFFIAVGRVFLALQCMAKRLNHLGLDCHVVGSITEKAITYKDLLIVASGSGESMVPLTIAQIAKEHNARVGLITSSDRSTIKSLADFCVHLKCPTKTNKNEGVKSVQPMSTLFDQSLHIFGDIVSLMIQSRRGMPSDELWKYHANLE